MGGERLSLEDRVELLAGQLETLSRRVDQLTLKMGAANERPALLTEVNGADRGDASEELLSWVGKSSLLQRLSTLCFLLVVALILRTIADSGLIDLQIGSLLGMGYASLLMFLGWRRYKKKNPLAPVFTICGAVLMFTIVVETHAHFESLPSVPAYILLMLTGLGMAALSYFYRVPAPISIGTLGMCLAGAAIDYPQPFFPYLGGVLLTANLLGYFTARAHKYSWLRWILLIVTMFMIQLWGIKLGIALLDKEEIPHNLAPSFFLPLLGLFSLTYMATAFLRIRGDVTGRLARFDLFVPTLNVVWAFLLARYVIFAMGGNVMLGGIFGVVAGLVHLGLAFWLVRGDKTGVPGVNAYVFAGSVLLVLALPVAMGGVLPSLPVLSVLAYSLVRISQKWQSASVRLTSYLLQVYAAIMLTFLLLPSQPDAYLWGGIVSAALLACFAFLQYNWCRAHQPPGDVAFFNKVDKNDLTASALLLGSLLSAFFLLRIVAYQCLLLLLPADAVNNAFHGTQSVIINVSAAILMLFALARQKKELRNIAIMITIIGAIKVFLYDLITGGMHGLPLVISVFSFGLSTALESFGLTRWHQFAPESAPEVTDTGSKA